MNSKKLHTCSCSEIMQSEFMTPQVGSIEFKARSYLISELSQIRPSINIPEMSVDFTSTQ